MEANAWFATIATALVAALVAAEKEVEAPTTSTASSPQKGARLPTPAFRIDMMRSDIKYCTAKTARLRPMLRSKKPRIKRNCA